MKKIFLSLFLTSGISVSLLAAEYAIIPAPQRLKPQNGVFELNKQTKFALGTFSDGDARQAIQLFIRQLAAVTSWNLDVVSLKEAPSGNVIMLKENKTVPAEGYNLTVGKTKIVIEASTPKGCFYALQTIRQLLPKEYEATGSQPSVKWSVPCCDINDAPKYRYRGLHVDVARHFATIDEVKTIIDQLALLKLNTFHWHLTDDQGWRIEIKKYPLLTSVGGFRDRTLIGSYKDIPRKFDQTRTGGFYTQEEVKDVIKYAADRYIDILPEIEMPGHAIAALAAYPQYSCSGGPFQVEGLWGIFNDVFCTKDDTFSFLEDILSEVIALFPYKYIHIGGDECPTIRWQNCAHCQARMKELGLKNERQLQSYFTHRIEQFVNSKGKIVVGWDEILDGGLTAPNAVVMSWRGEKGGIAAARLGHDVIMTPTTYLYFDYYQSQSPSEPLAIGGYVPIEKVYSYNPTPDSLTQEQATHILGVQANTWAEYMSTLPQREYMIFPRIAALSEVGWLDIKQRNYADFAKRLPALLARYDVMGINYSKAFYETLEKENGK